MNAREARHNCIVVDRHFEDCENSENRVAISEAAFRRHMGASVAAHWSLGLQLDSKTPPYEAIPSVSLRGGWSRGPGVEPMHEGSADLCAVPTFRLDERYWFALRSCLENALKDALGAPGPSAILQFAIVGSLRR
jgi:hypothetical protein